MSTNLKLFLLLFLSITLLSYKTIQQAKSSTEPAKYKVAILYPNGEDKTFNMDYYEKNHMPMMAGFIGKNLVSYDIDKGISGRTANDKPPFLAMGFFYINDIAEYNNAIAKNLDAVRGDIGKYTNIQPIIQISEIRKSGAH